MGKMLCFSRIDGKGGVYLEEEQAPHQGHTTGVMCLGPTAPQAAGTTPPGMATPLSCPKEF